MKILFFFFYANIIWSQTIGDRSNKLVSLSNGSNNIVQIKEFSRKFNPDTKGDHYYDKKYSLSDVVFIGENSNIKVSKKVFLRYNAFLDEVEIGLNPEQETINEILIKSKNISALINGLTYRYLPFINSLGNVEFGYLIAYVENDKYSFYERKFKYFMPAVKAITGLERDFDARYIEKSIFYFSYNKSTPQPFQTNKKGLKKVFGQKYKEALKIIKINDLKMKNPDHLLILFRKLNY